MKKAFYVRLINLWGLDYIGDYDQSLPRVVVAVVPHTSNWDFPLGLLVRGAMGGNIGFVGKSSLFRWPFGYVFRALGGQPVDRSKNNNYVDSVVNTFNSLERFHLCIAPEGTRKKVDQLKTGFYYIALKANAAIVLVKFDWGGKQVVVDKPYYVTGDIEKDFAYFHAFFKGAVGKNPEFSFEPNDSIT